MLRVIISRYTKCKSVGDMKRDGRCMRYDWSWQTVQFDSKTEGVDWILFSLMLALENLYLLVRLLKNIMMMFLISMSKLFCSLFKKLYPCLLMVDQLSWMDLSVLLKEFQVIVLLCNKSSHSIFLSILVSWLERASY